MPKTVIKVENLSKQYRLGQVGTGTISHDLNRWWAAMRGKEEHLLADKWCAYSTPPGYLSVFHLY